MTLPGPITLLIALLAAFLIFVTALKYAIHNTFNRTRFTMTGLFVFIVATLTISFWPFAFLTLPYTIPAFVFGMALGYVMGVQTEQQKLRAHGLEHYMEHFAHIHSEDVRRMTWWSIVNYYTIMSALILINLVGLSTVIFSGSTWLVIATSTVGALLIGTIVPYLAHLWSVPALHLLHREHHTESYDNHQ